MADQAGILFEQASSNPDAALLRTENAEMRRFAVQNEVAYKQDTQIQNY